MNDFVFLFDCFFGFLEFSDSPHEVGLNLAYYLMLFRVLLFGLLYGSLELLNLIFQVLDSF